MNSKSALGLNEKILIFGIPGVTLLVWTGAALDPVNLPKMLLLTLIAFSSVYGTYIQLKMNWRATPRIFLVLQFFSILWLFVALIGSENNVLESFFGVNGRYTGALTYVSFSFIAVAIVLNYSKSFYEKVLNSLIFAGVFNLIYCGYVIISNDDPLPWNNVYGNILGTLGNPNFISSFLGILNVALFVKLISNVKNIKLVFVWIGLLSISILEIIDSASRQGIIVTLVGCGAVFVYRVFSSSMNSPLKFISLGSYLAGGTLALFGMFQIGPLTNLIYKTSISIRGAYWRAGWETMLQNPLFGTGPDGFGDWYPRVRDERAMVLPGPNVITNSPHNIFIEQGVNGGFPLFVLYLSSQLYILVCGVRYLRNNSGFNPLFAVSFFGWLGFTAQSLISINQIGLAVWGYVLGGITIGTYHHAVNSTNSKIGHPKVFSKAKKEASIALTCFGGIVGLLLAFPPFYADANWRNALESKDLNKIVSAANQWPQSTDRYIQVIKLLFENKFYVESLEFTRQGLAFNQNSARLWYFLYQLPGSTEEEKESAIENLAKLDPNFVVK